MFSVTSHLRQTVQDLIVEYIDVDFALWLSWLLMPLIITFLLPLVIVILLYLTGLILYIYKLHRTRLRGIYGTDWMNAARNVVAAVWDAHGWIWHGYEIVGLENIPEDQPVLFVYYHGAIPVDIYYFMSKIFLSTSRVVHTVADRFLFKIPGFSIISDSIKVIPGTIQTCSNILKEGNMLAISPGGVYEAQFGDSYYELMWKQRVGFAKVALDAKVCIIPFFTRNIREAFRQISWGRRIWLRIYAATRCPCIPLYGGFPVKLTTYIGKPIPYDSTLTPEELQVKVADALNSLIREHQRIPGNISLALFERVYDAKKSKQS
ncbi:hypothetical protein KM043_004998 [Ampulex compressa]|nr:hypothetical protein KM043_004998 [Ampulex compressa]